MADLTGPLTELDFRDNPDFEEYGQEEDTLGWRDLVSIFGKSVLRLPDHCNVAQPGDECLAAGWSKDD